MIQAFPFTSSRLSSRHSNIITNILSITRLFFEAELRAREFCHARRCERTPSVAARGGATSAAAGCRAEVPTVRASCRAMP